MENWKDLNTDDIRQTSELTTYLLNAWHWSASPRGDTRGRRPNSNASLTIKLLNLIVYLAKNGLLLLVGDMADYTQRWVRYFVR